MSMPRCAGPARSPEWLAQARTTAASGAASRAGRPWRRSRCAPRRGTRRPRPSLILICSRRLIGAALDSARPPAPAAPTGSRHACRHGPQASHGRADGLARVLGLEHRGVARFPEDLPHEPVDAGEAQLDHDRSVARSSTTRRASRAQRARSGETHTRALREACTSPVRSQPSTSAAGSTSGRGSNVSPVTVTRLIRSRRKWRIASRSGSNDATYQPSRPFVSAYGSTRRSRQLVLVLLVVLELDHPPLDDRVGDQARDARVVAAGAARPAGPAPSGPRRAPPRSSRART